MDEIKELLKSLVSMTVKNSKDEDGTGKEAKVNNEDVDKRDIIKQIMAIAGKDDASEDVKTIAKLAEKLAYDKSEAGSADNRKVKNEVEKTIVEKEKENEEEDDKKVENKCNKVKNSKIDWVDRLNNVYNSLDVETESNEGYTSRFDRLEAGKKYFE